MYPTETHSDWTIHYVYSMSEIPVKGHVTKVEVIRWLQKMEAGIVRVLSVVATLLC